METRVADRVAKRKLHMRSKDAELKKNIIEIIDEYYESELKSPTLQHIADALKINKSTVSKYISAMIEEGEIEKNSRFGDLRTKKMQKTQNSTVKYPIVGEIACGTPIFAEENIQSYVTFSKDFLGQGDYFLLKAKGDSMINAGIADGDLVVVRQQETAEEGQIVVALIENEATLKRYFLDRRHKRIRLHPENDEMEDMYYKEVSIQGIAVKVIKSLF